MNKLYYSPVNGYLCDRYPNDIPHTDETPFIEVDDDTYGQTFACEYGKTWAVINGELTVIDDANIMATPEYQKNSLENEIFMLQSFLTETDYITLKLAEAQINNDETKFVELKTKYASILEQREQTRQQLSDLKEQLEAFADVN